MNLNDTKTSPASVRDAVRVLLQSANPSTVLYTLADGFDAAGQEVRSTYAPAVKEAIELTLIAIELWAMAKKLEGEGR